jgi:hypothetical protein
MSQSNNQTTPQPAMASQKLSVIQNPCLPPAITTGPSKATMPKIATHASCSVIIPAEIFPGSASRSPTIIPAPASVQNTIDITPAGIRYRLANRLVGFAISAWLDVLLSEIIAIVWTPAF